MTRLDHDRGVGQLASKLNVGVDDLHNFCVWGNHSPTMYPDTTHATLTDGRRVSDLVDNEWLTSYFMPTVQQRGGAIIAARKLSSAASAGNAAIGHMRDWVYGTQGNWTSFSVPSDGSYGIESGLIYSYPVTVENGKWNIVQGLNISPESRALMDKTKAELLTERTAVEHLL